MITTKEQESSRAQQEASGDRQTVAHSIPSYTAATNRSGVSHSSHGWGCRTSRKQIKQKEYLRLWHEQGSFCLTWQSQPFSPVLGHAIFIPRAQQSDLFQQRYVISKIQYTQQFKSLWRAVTQKVLPPENTEHFISSLLTPLLRVWSTFPI